MWLCHGWGWQPPQTASHIHIRHIQCLITLICCLLSYGSSLTHLHPPYLAPIWGSGSLVESNRCDYVMVETDSHLKLLPTSILAIYNVFELIDMLSMCLQYQPYTYVPTPFGSDFGALGHLHGVKMMWLCHGWGWQPPQTASNIHIGHIQSVWAHWYAGLWHMLAALYCFTHPNWLRDEGLGHLWSQNDVIMSWLRLTAT